MRERGKERKKHVAFCSQHVITWSKKSAQSSEVQQLTKGGEPRVAIVLTRQWGHQPDSSKVT